MASTASSLTACLLLLASWATPQVRERQCGFDRWAVKTLADRDIGRINFNPVDTTIASLVALRIHEIPYPNDSRIEPEELRVYRVKARLIAVKRESDQDLHVIIADLDRPTAMMVVEIPAPRCASAKWSEQFTVAREAVQKLSAGALITVTGVGFWDYIHGQGVTGAAPNGFELHPVLSIQ